jgi:hypothetical protein
MPENSFQYCAGAVYGIEPMLELQWPPGANCAERRPGLVLDLRLFRALSCGLLLGYCS